MAGARSSQELVVGWQAVGNVGEFAQRLAAGKRAWLGGGGLDHLLVDCAAGGMPLPHGRGSDEFKGLVVCAADRRRWIFLCGELGSFHRNLSWFLCNWREL